MADSVRVLLHQALSRRSWPLVAEALRQLTGEEVWPGSSPSEEDPRPGSGKKRTLPGTTSARPARIESVTPVARPARKKRKKGRGRDEEEGELPDNPEEEEELWEAIQEEERPVRRNSARKLAGAKAIRKEILEGDEEERPLALDDRDTAQANELIEVSCSKCERTYMTIRGEVEERLIDGEPRPRVCTACLRKWRG